MRRCDARWIASVAPLAALLAVITSCGDASAEATHAAAAAPAAIPQVPNAPSAGGAAAEADALLACETRVAALTAELRHEHDLRLEREREWLRYTQRMARLMELAGAPTFQPEVPAEKREARALETDPEKPAATADAEVHAQATENPAPLADAAQDEPAAETDPSHAHLHHVAALAREERSRAAFLALRSLFAIEHISGLDLLDSGTVAQGATGPVVLRVIDERGRPLGSLYAERLRLEGSHAARTLSLILEKGWERRGGVKLPFEGGTVDAEGRGGVRRIELAHVDPTPWFEALPELFREDQRAAATQGDPAALNSLRFELNRRLRADASGPVYRLDSLTAQQGLVLREVHVSVLTPELLLERELFADHMSILRAEKGLEIVLEGGSQVRGSEKVPFLDGRYRIFLPRANAEIWEAAGIPLGRRPDVAGPESSASEAVAPAEPATPVTPGG